MDKKNLLHIGKIANTFGIKGDLKLAFNKDIKINHFDNFELIFISLPEQQLLPFKISNFRIDKNNLIIHLNDLDNINRVLHLKNKAVYFVNTNNDFEKEITLLDYKITYNDQDVEIIDMMSNGVYNLIKISFNNKLFWVPLVDKYLQEYDKKNHFIVLKDIEGLQ